MPTLFRTKPRALLGLDINPAAITLVELSFINHQYVLSWCDRALLDDPVGMHDANRIAELIRPLSEKASSKRAVLAMPDAHITRQTLQIPADVHADEVEAWVLMTAQSSLSYPLHELYLDFVITGFHPSGLREVLLMSCHAQHLKIRLEAVRCAGLLAHIVDIESYALARVECLENPLHEVSFSKCVNAHQFMQEWPLFSLAFGLAMRCDAP
jgi:type IV pilus assembly protein PilM